MRKLNFENFKKQNGITLVALIVTIVVLLILAGVTVTYVFSDNGILSKAQTAATETDVATTKEKIQYALLEAIVANNEYTVQDVINSAEQVTGSTVDISEGTVQTAKGNTLDISDLLNGASDTVLGISSNQKGYVVGEISSGEGTGIMYVKLTGQDIEDNYNTRSYPTTTCTFTEDGETHNYIFAGWYEVDDGESYFGSMPTSSSEYAYARFVDENVMKIYCIFTPASITGSGNFWGFVSSLDDSEYYSYQIVLTGTDGTTISTIGSDSMSRYSNSLPVSSIDKTFTPSDDFSSVSSYLVTGSYTDSSSSYTSITATVRWTRADGTCVEGPSYTFNIDDNVTSTTLLAGTKL